MNSSLDLLFSALIAVIAVAFLTAQQKQYERKLRDSLKEMHAMMERTSSFLHEYRKFKAAFDSSYDAMVIADKDGKILYMNDSATRVTGFSRQESLGSKAGTLWGKLMPRKFYQTLWKQIKIDKKPFYGKMTNHRKNGERYEAAASITPVFDDEQKKVEYFVAVERDLGETSIKRK